MNLKNKRILIISSHPDDEALNSGGLIMRAKAEKADVFVLYMATGESRQFVNGRTYESQRIQEAKYAAKFGGFRLQFGFDNISTKLDTMPQKDLMEFIEDRVQEFMPHIVVIPMIKSYSQDHRAIAEACISAFRPIPQELHHQPQIILESEEATSWPQGFSPNFFVDISHFMAEKLNLYKCHISQVTTDPQYRSCENLTRLAGYRGSEIGVKYAEAYKLLKMSI